MGKPNMELIKKSIDTSILVSGGGFMPDEVADKFLLEVFQSNALLSRIRTVIMKSKKQIINTMGIGEKLMRKIGEHQDASATKGGFATVQTGQIEMTTEKYGLPWEITEEFLEDNIESRNINRVIADFFIGQMGRDTEYHAVNGEKVDPIPSTTVATIAVDGVTDPIDVVVADVSGFPRNSEAGWLVIDSEKLSYEYIDIGAKTFKNCERAQDGTTIAVHAIGQPVTWEGHQLTGSDNGWLAQMYAGNSNFVDLSAINSGNISKGHFFELKRALPKKYRTNSELIWLLGSDQFDKWIEYLSERVTALGDSVIVGGKYLPLGIQAIEVPSWPEDTIALTWAKNLILGVWRRLRMRSVDSDSRAVLEDTILYNMTTRIGFNIERTDAVAIGNGLNV
jgi:hypothetical protein